MESFLVAMNAVIPFLFYITFGYTAKIKGVVSEEFLQKLNKMVFRLFYPFMTFYNIYKADPTDLPRPILMIFTGASILILEAILVIVIPKIVKENPRRGVIIQAIYRSNFILFGLPLTLSVFGDSASSIAAMLITIVTTIYNTTSVVILEMFNTKGKMLQDIIVSLGGRVAEELVFEDITTGASQDIKQATAQARAMVTKFGFSDKVGLINYETDDDEVFLGRDLGHAKAFSEETSLAIDQEVKRIMDECYAKARKILEEHSEVLHSCASLLMEKERITREEFESLFQSPAVEVE